MRTARTTLYVLRSDCAAPDGSRGGDLALVAHGHSLEPPPGSLLVAFHECFHQPFGTHSEHSRGWHCLGRS